MRRELADLLRRLANRIWTDEHHHSQLTITDEYGICRCRLGIDDHGIDSEFVALPSGWDFRTEDD